MKKKGAGESPSSPVSVLVYIVLIVFILAVLLFAFGGEAVRQQIPFAESLPTFGFGKEKVDATGIIRYDLDSKDVQYYTGTSWVSFPEGSDTFIGEFKFTREGLKEDFEDYFYDSSDRQLPYLLDGSFLDANDENPLRGVVIQDLVHSSEKSSLSFLGDKGGIAIGSLDRQQRVGQGFNFVTQSFLVDFEGNFYRTDDGLDYGLAGKLVNSRCIGPRDDVYDIEVASLNAYSFVEDSELRTHLASLNGLILDGSTFYEEDQYGCRGEASDYRVSSSNPQGSNWVLYKGTPISVYFTTSETFYARNPSGDDYAQSSSPNELELIEVVEDWRDVVFNDPIRIGFDSGDDYGCVEVVSHFFVVDLDNGVEASDVC